LSNRKKSNQSKPVRYGKYLAAGVIAAGIIFGIFYSLEKDENTVPHVWSREVDSAFVVNCVSKYAREFRQDTTKRTQTIEFCLCMLEKVKTKYEEKDIDKVTNEDIKTWDRLCRSQSPNKTE